MKRLLTLVAVILTTALFATQGASNANAQSILYVSRNGSDADPACSTPATACRSINSAISRAVDGSIISCVDAGYFGSASVTKSITIDCLAGGGDANMQNIIINA